MIQLDDEFANDTTNTEATKKFIKTRLSVIQKIENINELAKRDLAKQVVAVMNKYNIPVTPVNASYILNIFSSFTKSIHDLLTKEENDHCVYEISNYTETIPIAYKTDNIQFRYDDEHKNQLDFVIYSPLYRASNDYHKILDNSSAYEHEFYKDYLISGFMENNAVITPDLSNSDADFDYKVSNANIDFMYTIFTELYKLFCLYIYNDNFNTKIYGIIVNSKIYGDIKIKQNKNKEHFFVAYLLKE